MLFGGSDTIEGHANGGPRIKVGALGTPIGFRVDVDQGHDPAVGFVNHFPGHVDAFEVDNNVISGMELGHSNTPSGSSKPNSLHRNM